MRIFFRKDNLSDLSDYKDPATYLEKMHSHFSEKADHNKTESEFFIVLAAMSAIAAGIVVGIGDGLFWGKMLPATLNGVVVFSIFWLRVREPQKKWGIFRRAQRQLMAEKIRFESNLTPYDESGDRGKILAEALIRIMDEAHAFWEKTLPDITIITEALTNDKKRDE